MSTFFNTNRGAFLGIIFCLAVLSLLLAYTPRSYSQGAGSPITGWAWSDNIGWVSLSGSGYGLSVGSSGVITGYAWGDNIGWIAADAACGTQATVSGSTVTGWLHALNTGSDGCIKLNPNNNASDVTYSAGTITGYAWGSDTVGWLQFNGVANLTPATCTMNANPSVMYALTPPPSITLSYTTQNAVSASIAANPSSSPAPGSVPPAGTSASVAPPSAPAVTTTYTMTVTNSSATTNTCNTTVTVNSGYAPPAGCLSINANNPSCTAPVAKSVTVKKGTSVALYWTIANVTSCSLTANGSAVAGAPSTGSNTAGYSTGAITTRTQYALSCAGQDSSTFIDRAVINILPEFKEI